MTENNEELSKDLAITDSEGRSIVGMLLSPDMEDTAMAIELLHISDIKGINYSTAKLILQRLTSFCSEFRKHKSVGHSYSWKDRMPFWELVPFNNKWDKDREGFNEYHKMDAHAKIKFLVRRIKETGVPIE